MPYSRRGFSLLEVLIVLGITGVVAGSAVAIGLAISGARSKAGSVEEVQANTRIALELLSNRIRAATSVDVAGSVFGTDPGVLALRMDDPERDPTMFSLTADDGALLLREGAAASGALTSNAVAVTQFRLSNVAPTGAPANIRIELTVAAANAGDANIVYVESVETAVSIRR